MSHQIVPWVNDMEFDGHRPRSWTSRDASLQRGEATTWALVTKMWIEDVDIFDICVTHTWLIEDVGHFFHIANFI